MKGRDLRNEVLKLAVIFLLICVNHLSTTEAPKVENFRGLATYRFSLWFPQH